jgi:hypothetical protein
LQDFKAWYIQPKSDGTSIENEFLLLERETEPQEVERFIFQVQQDGTYCMQYGVNIAGELEYGTCDLVRTFSIPDGGGYYNATFCTVTNGDAPDASLLYKLYNMYSEDAQTETQIAATKEEIKKVCAWWRKSEPRAAWFDDYSEFLYSRNMVAVDVKIYEFY